ncbi:hypothetical protein [Hypericibacter terrae]|nr:hypothetical protein [Hypericibacter terrae]
MRRVLMLAAMAALLAGCQATPQPIVDMEGVAQVQYNRDMAWCVNNQPFIALGNPVTDCMRGKGYRILVGY